MARSARGRGRGKRGREPAWANGLSTSEPRRGRRLVEHLINKAAATYREGTDVGICKLLEEWEGETK